MRRIGGNASAAAKGGLPEHPGDAMSRLLIVDDEPEYLDELVEALSFEGLQSISVPSGAEAIEMLRRESDITIVLTDIRMPDMDGIALMDAIKAEFPSRPIKFVVMTGHAAEVDIARAHAAGAAKCFPKPLAFESLCDTLLTLDGARNAVN